MTRRHIHGWMKTGFAIGAAGLALAQDAPDLLDPIAPASAEMVVDARPPSAKPAPQTPGDRFGLDLNGGAVDLPLPAIDSDALLAEDAAEVAGRIFTSLRAGVSRSLGASLSSEPGGWTEIVGVGRVWRAVVSADGARALRVRFDQVHMPAGAELWLRSLDMPDMVQGPLTGVGPLGTGEFWSTVLGGPRVLVEYFVPAGVAADGAFELPEIMHVYRDLLAPMSDQIVSREGACHTDVMCEPAWQPLHNSVARVTFINGSNLDLCTGTLIATTALDQTPYFWTAQHCCQTQAAAQTAVMFWFFQTDACNGTVPPLNGVPTTTYADLLSSRSINAGSDYSFLMVRGALPSGLSWAGWDTAQLTLGTIVSCIHHPTGAYKRIMHGSRQTVTGVSTDFWGIIWSSGGTVEFSTSGAPLFRDDNQKFVGQASFVTQSTVGCSNPTNPAGFGRFLRAFPNVQGFLAAGTDDAFDTAASNNACATASLISANYNGTGLIVKSVAEDWYAIQIPACQQTSVTINYTQAFGDVDAQLYDACGGNVIASGLGTTGSESLAAENRTGQPRTVYLRVFLDSSTRNTYDMNIALSAISGCSTLCPGDLNGDRSVDLTDLATMLTNFGLPSGATRAQGDLDTDGDVDLTDLANLLSLFGTTCP